MDVVLIGNSQWVPRHKTIRERTGSPYKLEIEKAMLMLSGVLLPLCLRKWVSIEYR